MEKRNGLLKFGLLAILLTLGIQFIHFSALAQDDDPVIYGTYASINMGNPGEVTKRDFYINLGTKQGVKVGQRIEALRKIPTHDLLNKRLQKDMLFPIGLLRVIHVEQTASIARIEKIYPEENTPAMAPRTIMVGDLVRPPTTVK